MSPVFKVFKILLKPWLSGFFFCCLILLVPLKESSLLWDISDMWCDHRLHMGVGPLHFVLQYGGDHFKLIRCFHKPVTPCLHQTKPGSDKILVPSGFWCHTVGWTTSVPLTLSGEANGAVTSLLGSQMKQEGLVSGGGPSAACKSDPVAA